MTTARPTVTPTQFRTLMSTFPAGVAVVTASEPGGPLRGTTCSSVSSVSTEPATLLVCLQQDSPTLAALLGAASFAVNLLHDQAEAVAELFASRVTDRFDQVRWRHEPCFGGPHLFDGAHTIADCRVAGTALVGDHVVVFGEVFQVSTPAGPSPNPLLYGLRSYWSLGPVPKAVNTIYSARP
ncbi:flavin reductase family protein [Streptomyces natalensis]|uniref:flavin reductase family protein n=1 Tax=Streptomyces natalensis TaxID=68242 RepID=UPI001F52360C|nr:flavin reductase family protein [Streptomyces natalensis]